MVDPSAEMIRAIELLGGVLGAQGIDVESFKKGQFRPLPLPLPPPPAPAVPTLPSGRELALELVEKMKRELKEGGEDCAA